VGSSELVARSDGPLRGKNRGLSLMRFGRTPHYDIDPHGRNISSP
jgi:hypothetical protein